MTLSEAFAHFIQHPVPLGEEEVYLCTRSILDTVGAMVLGSRTGVVEKAARVIPRAGKATLAGIGGGFSARDAAFLNGISGHELELDDTSSSNLGHPTVAVLPALLALGEELNSPGEELIRAFAVATEVECKLGRLCAHALHERGWHASSVTGIVGAAAGAAYLLKLKEKELVNCLGIAASMAAGVRENFGTDTKSLHIGKAAADGLLAAVWPGKAVPPPPPPWTAGRATSTSIPGFALTRLVQTGTRPWETDTMSAPPGLRLNSIPPVAVPTVQWMPLLIWRKYIIFNQRTSPPSGWN
ncbi:MmgE/PrpD family protein [Flavonifractor plautii]|uniref:MmgE/PrpD family protein n=1 Tax=Flavonifractor plautii TaxID=292800 RepID=UPI0024B99424|nr:MmgE/PrpD family protein [Flavonifractor plautii]